MDGTLAFQHSEFVLLPLGHVKLTPPQPPKTVKSSLCTTVLGSNLNEGQRYLNYFEIVVRVLLLEYCSTTVCLAPPHTQRTKVRVFYICVFVRVQSHREEYVWSEARLRGHSKDTMMQYTPLVKSPESVTQACRLN